VEGSTSIREAGFEIGDERYSIPSLGSLTLDEERLLFIYADAVVQDFIPAHPDWSEEEVDRHERVMIARVRNPAFKRTLAHIAYRRRHPEIEDDEIQDLLGEVVALDLDVAVLRGDTDDEDPTETTSPNGRERTNELSGHEKYTDGGTPIEMSSGSPESNPETSGITESDTSSPQSRETTSEL
jgi:hypothetical protein